MEQLGVSADQLDKALEGVGRSSKSARGQLLTMAGASVAFQGLQSALAGLQSTINDLSAAWQVQIEAETKLQTVMRQRMDATEQDIQSIKDLCSAQQQLGIIGDEVQLAGAQQLATFLTERQALETLIPAMNNLVAQQKGYNATAQDAANIANLFGKAMQGQASALRRVGITFDEAQEAAIKNGTESERAAALAQIITANVGEMNAALAATPTGKMKQLSNTLGDVKEEFGRLAVKIQPVTSMLSSVVGTMAQVGMAATGLKAGGSALKSMFTSVAASVSATTKAMTAARVASIALKAALGGIVVAGVAAAVWGISKAWEDATLRMRQNAEIAEVVTRHAKDLENAQKKGAEASAQAAGQIEVNITRLKEFNGSKEKERKLVDEMNQTYGDTMGYYSSVNGWLEALTKNAGAYCEMLSYQIQLQEIANSMAKIKQEQYDLDHNEDGSLKTFSTKKPDIITSGMPGFGTGFYDATNVVTKRGKSEKEIRDEKAAALNKQLEQQKKRAEELAAAMAKITFTKGSASPPTWTKPPIKPEVELPDSYAEFKNLGQFDELLKRLGQRRLTIGQADLAGLDAYIERVKVAREMFEGRTDGTRSRSLKGTARGSISLPSVDIEKLKKSAIQNIKAPDLSEYRAGLKQMQEETIDALGAVNSVWSSIGGIAGGIKSITNALDENASAWDRVSGIVGGALQILNAVNSVLPIVNALTKSNTNAEMTNAGAIQGALAIKKADTTATVAEAAAETMKTHASIPFAGIAIAGGLIAAMIAAMFALPKFAKGGLAYGPTVGLFGEYSGASNNPEVVAPLDRLRSMLEPQGLGGDVHFYIRGDVLEGVLERRRQKTRRI